LPLKPYQEYCLGTTEIGYSLKQIYYSVMITKSDLIAWDDILDSVFYIKVFFDSEIK